MFFFPLLVDEVFSYVYFVSQGVPVAMTYYPGPNNHIFFNVIAALFNPLFVWFWKEPVWGMRLISLGASLLCSAIVFFEVYRRYNFRIAWWACLLLNLQIPFFTYSILGRGYMLQVCLMWISCMLGLQLIQNTVLTSVRFLYVCTAVLGFYCIPTFLYPYFALTFFLFFQVLRPFSYALVRRLFLVNLWVVLLTTFLYAPVILLNGWKALSGNSWVASLSWVAFWEGIPGYWQELNGFFWDDTTGLAGLCFGILLGIYSFKIFRQKKSDSSLSRYRVLILFLILAPIPLLVFQRLLPFPRVWMYLSIPITWICMELSTYFFNKKEVLILCALSFIQILLLMKVFWVDYQTPEMAQIIEKILSSQPKQLLVNEDTYLTFIQYEALKKRQNLRIDTQIQAEKAYSWLILSQRQKVGAYDDSTSYVLYKEDELVKIYQKKSP